MTLRLCAAIGTAGLVLGMIVAFREGQSAPLLATSGVLLALALFADRAEKLTAKIGDHEFTIPLRPVVAAVHELRAALADPIRSTQLEVAMQNLERTIAGEVVDTFQITAISAQREGDLWRISASCEIELMDGIAPDTVLGFDVSCHATDGDSTNLNATAFEVVSGSFTMVSPHLVASDVYEMPFGVLLENDTIVVARELLDLTGEKPIWTAADRLRHDAY